MSPLGFYGVELIVMVVNLLKASLSTRGIQLKCVVRSASCGA